MIIFTGAAGKTGQAVIRALHKRNMPVRALVHKDTHIPRMLDLGVEEIVVGDMGSLRLMEKVLVGVTAVYHICPNVHPHEIEIGQTIINAARAARVDHFVYHSVFHPHIKAMPHHWQKMHVEAQLFTSGLAYTILQPAPYMQNILAYWDDIINTGSYRLPYSKQKRIGCVDLEDVAEVAALVLCEPGHTGATYELCSDDNLSAQETAQIISQYVGHAVTVDTIPSAEWANNARRNRLDDYQVETLSKIFDYYDQFGYTGNSRILTCLLDRAPTSFTAFIKKTINH